MNELVYIILLDYIFIQYNMINIYFFIMYL